MEKKYLLYIDILGFSNLVMADDSKVRRLYYIIENLNAHKHDSFNVIVFSDTILIYNKEEPISPDDHRYLVMYMIEFTQNLMYELVGKSYYFRAVLVYGEFEHTSPDRIERFFGKALITAYLKEKDLNCTGLFIDKFSQQYNPYFPVKHYDNEFSFVYMNRSLDNLTEGNLPGPIPVDPYLLDDTDSQWNIAKDVIMLKDIHYLMRNHKDSRVKEKFLMTWDFYHQRHPELLNALEKNKFDLSVISKDFDWKEAISRVSDGYRGYGISAPSDSEFLKIIKEARELGKKAAQNKYIEIYGSLEAKQHFIPCGGAIVILDVDGRYPLGKFFSKFDGTSTEVSISKSPYLKGFRINIGGMHHCQGRAIDEAAQNAVFEVLRKRLGIDGYVSSYYD